MAPDRRKRPITTAEAGGGERGLWHGRVSGVTGTRGHPGATVAVRPLCGWQGTGSNKGPEAGRAHTAAHRRGEATRQSHGHIAVGDTRKGHFELRQCWPRRGAGYDGSKGHAVRGEEVGQGGGQRELHGRRWWTAAASDDLGAHGARAMWHGGSKGMLMPHGARQRHTGEGLVLRDHGKLRKPRGSGRRRMQLIGVVGL